MAFPEQRLRRLRRTPALRALARETRLHPGDLIDALFVVEGRAVREPISSMPGVLRLSVDQLADEAKRICDLGLGGVILFGIPAHKDALGTSGYDPDGIIARAIRTMKSASPELVVIADICMCEYTDHGHCGVVHDGAVSNDETLPLLARSAVVAAEAGADVVAPSDMMDGRVAAIRRGLDAAGLSGTPILSYAAKYASAFYGPFREAAESAPKSGDRRGYQMDAGNAREALREIAADVEEGADMVMVKPAMPCLDVVRQAREHFDLPIFAYQVSGEYSMLQAAISRGWLEAPRVVDESLLAIRRAGADRIVTYFAKDFAGRYRG
ncbi:MAG: porphobilinogen synthase [Deltaproteobacteria bacterium]|nr:porphobilinogen synthase [Deltaproteobacteria bacterium]